nr:hypothetical protein [Tanacetum cinerariifolium]
MDQDSAHMVVACKEVIENGATLPKIQVVKGVTIVMPITSVTDEAQRRLEVKVRSTLRMGIPNEHPLKFNSIKDAKQLLEAIEKRFGFKSWNKADLDTMSMDDLYKNLKVYEPEVKGMSSSNSNTQNIAFLSSTNSSTNRVVNIAQAVNTANGVSTASTQVNAAFSTNIDNLSDAIIYKKTKRKPTINGNETLDFDMSKVECYNYHKRGHFAREYRAPRNQENKHKESTRRNVPVETPASTTLVSCDGFDGYNWSDQAKEGPNYALMAYTSLSSDSKMFSSESDVSMPPSPVYDRYQSGEGYHVVPPPYTGTFMPLKPDLVFHDAPNVNKTVHTAFNVKLSPTKPDTNLPHSHRPSAPIIEDWDSDSEDDSDAEPTQNAPSFV